MVGIKEKKEVINTSDNLSFTNEYTFCGRFHPSHFSIEPNLLKGQFASGQLIITTEEEVLRTLKGMNPRKAQCPDGIRGYVLKECIAEPCAETHVPVISR